jgi:hypothetical protein
MTAVSCGIPAREGVMAWRAGTPVRGDPIPSPEVDPSPPPVEPTPPITAPGPPTPVPVLAVKKPRGPHRSKVTDAEEHSDPAMLPVEQDEGLVPPAIPDDPEHDRQVDPEA